MSPSLILLISRQSIDQHVVTRQAMVQTTLEAHGVDFTIIDGADPAERSKRNELFELSGRRAQYPQLFLSNEDGYLSFWGGFDEFQEVNESDMIATDLKELLHSGQTNESNDTTEFEAQEESDASAKDEDDDLREGPVLSKPPTEIAEEQSAMDASSDSVTRTVEDVGQEVASEVNSEASHDSMGETSTVSSHTSTKTSTDDTVNETANDQRSSNTEDELPTSIDLVDDHASVEDSDTSPESDTNHLDKASPASPRPTEGKKSLLVLVTQQTFDRGVIDTQQMALTILDSLGIEYTTLDGAAPENKDRRNELFGISGRRAQYPQFFFTEGQSITFWGGWNEFQHANEYEEIQIQFGNDPKQSITDEEEEQKEHQLDMDDFDDKSTTSSLKHSEGKSLLVLVSQLSIDQVMIANQEKALAILDSQGIEYTTLDGAAPENKDRRNELFSISGVRAQYPQFFCIQGDSTFFLGDWNHFQCANDSGALPEEFSNCGDEVNSGKLLYVEDSPRETQASPRFDSTQDFLKEVSQSYDDSETGALYSDESSNSSCFQLLVLLSRQSFDREVIANQEKALVALDSNGIKYEILDGADCMNKERRNELFEISGLRAKYPQFFEIHGSKTIFWGAWDKFQAANESNGLPMEFAS